MNKSAKVVLDRPQDSQRESLVRYFRVGDVGQRQGRRAAVPAPNTFSQEWANYIAARIRRAGDHTLRIAMETVGQVLAEERDKLRAEFRAELEREVAALRNEFLTIQLDQARGRTLKTVQSSPVALIA
ncbi:MAG: hypothetical protein WA754_20995 [Pseudolabrys sp.]